MSDFTVYKSGNKDRDSLWCTTTVIEPHYFVDMAEWQTRSAKDAVSNRESSNLSIHMVCYSVYPIFGRPSFEMHRNLGQVVIFLHISFIEECSMQAPLPTWLNGRAIDL